MNSKNNKITRGIDKDFAEAFKKSAFFLTLLFLIAYAACQNNMNVKIDLMFNNYSVCDLSDNFKVYFFTLDAENNYKMEEAVTTGKSIHVNLDFANTKLLSVIFRYKSYTLIFDEVDFFQKHLSDGNILHFAIEKWNCYKKYIRKSYSKRKERKSGALDVEISCNGLQNADGTTSITVLNTEYRKNQNKYFRSLEKIWHDPKAKGVIKVSSEVSNSRFAQSLNYEYRNYEKFFVNSNTIFQKMLQVTGKQKSEVIW